MLGYKELKDFRYPDYSIWWRMMGFVPCRSIPLPVWGAKDGLVASRLLGLGLWVLGVCVASSFPLPKYVPI